MRQTEFRSATPHCRRGARETTTNLRDLTRRTRGFRHTSETDPAAPAAIGRSFSGLGPLVALHKVGCRSGPKCGGVPTRDRRPFDVRGDARCWGSRQLFLELARVPCLFHEFTRCGEDCRALGEPVTKMTATRRGRDDEVTERQQREFAQRAIATRGCESRDEESRGKAPDP